MRVRKKSIEVEAVHWTGDNHTEVYDFMPGAKMSIYTDDHAFLIETLEGTMRAKMGDWIIKGVQGEFYPCAPEIFNATYEVV